MIEPLTTEIFITDAIKIHGSLYDYSKVEYKSAVKNVIIGCKVHGYFTQQPRHHTNGHGCRKCAAIDRAAKQVKSKETFIAECIAIHKNKYDYSRVHYINDGTKVSVRCIKHDFVFNVIPSNIIRNKHGCPKCNASKGEEKIRSILNQKHVVFIEQKRFEKCRYKKPLVFDFYIPELNMCIEFDGRQHFIPLSFSKDQTLENKIKQFSITKKRDEIKNNFCLENNISLLRIKFDDSIEEMINSLI